MKTVRERVRLSRRNVEMFVQAEESREEIRFGVRICVMNAGLARVVRHPESPGFWKEGWQWWEVGECGSP